jgi:hypothetical protein
MLSFRSLWNLKVRALGRRMPEMEGEWRESGETAVRRTTAIAATAVAKTLEVFHVQACSEDPL